MKIFHLDDLRVQSSQQQPACHTLDSSFTHPTLVAPGLTSLLLPQQFNAPVVRTAHRWEESTHTPFAAVETPEVKFATLILLEKLRSACCLCGKLGKMCVLFVACCIQQLTSVSGRLHCPPSLSFLVILELHPCTYIRSMYQVSPWPVVIIPLKSQQFAIPVA